MGSPALPAEGTSSDSRQVLEFFHVHRTQQPCRQCLFNLSQKTGTDTEFGGYRYTGVRRRRAWTYGEGCDRAIRVEVGFREHAARVWLGNSCAERLLLPEHTHLKTNYCARAHPTLLHRQIAELFRKNPWMPIAIVGNQRVDSLTAGGDDCGCADDVLLGFIFHVQLKTPAVSTWHLAFDRSGS